MAKVYVAISHRYKVVGFHPDKKKVKKFIKNIDKRKYFNVCVMDDEELNACWLIEGKNNTTFDLNEQFNEYVSTRDAEFDTALRRLNELNEFIKFTKEEETLIDDLVCLENELSEFGYSFPTEEDYPFEYETNKITVKSFLNTLKRTSI